MKHCYVNMHVFMQCTCFTLQILAQSSAAASVLMLVMPLASLGHLLLPGCANAVTLSQCHLLSSLKHKRWQLLDSHCSAAVLLLLFSLAEIHWLG